MNWFTAILDRIGTLFNPQSAIPNPQSIPPSARHVKASSFADPGDVRAYRECIAEGHGQQFCFSVGDNGVGAWGDDCTGPTPMCALPVEDWLTRWGSKENAHNKEVVVVANGVPVVCLLRDTMPHRANIKNGAGIDLSPSTVGKINCKPPLMIDAVWWWLEDEPDTLA